MSTARYVHWQDGNMWLGYLERFPDYMTQGESLAELEENLRDLYRDLTSGDIAGTAESQNSRLDEADRKHGRTGRHLHGPVNAILCTIVNRALLREGCSMKRWAMPIMAAGLALGIVWLAGLTMIGRAAAQAPAAKPRTAGEAFKNVTASTLKGLSVDDFVAVMGVISADLGLDCADCHPGAGTDKVDWVVDTPRKKTARKMVEMVAAINRGNFGGAQLVTCFTCHHGRDIPSTTIALDTLYGPPNEEKDDIVASNSEEPSAEKILDKYIEALGGAKRLSGLSSFIATGTSGGYGGLGGRGQVEIAAKAPDQRAVRITFKEHPERGESARLFNGSAGWIKSPRGLFPEYEVIGSELNGLKLDAQLSFPGQIKQVLTNLRVGTPDNVNGRDVEVVQGSGPNGILATLYFDRQSGLLARLVRYAKSPVGRIPTQFDYADYREADGIKFPFKITVAWMDGKDAFQLDQVKTNVPVDAAKFSRAPSGGRQ